MTKLLAVVLALAAAALSVAALDPIASVSPDDGLPTVRTGVDWVVALELNAAGASNGAAALPQLQQFLRDCWAALQKGSTTWTTDTVNRFGLVYNGAPVLGLTASNQAVVDAIAALQPQAAYVPNYDLALSGANQVLFGAGVTPLPNARVATLVTNGGATLAAGPNAAGLYVARALKYKQVTVTTVALRDVAATAMYPPLVLHDLHRLANQRSGSNHYHFDVPVTPQMGYYAGYKGALPLLMTRVRNDPGHQCLHFGDPHIVTFDSNFYAFQGLGEYWLATSLDPASSPYLAVAVRQSLCGSTYHVTTPLSGAVAVPHATCARDYAVTDGTDTWNFVSQATATPSPASTANAATVAVTIVVNNATLSMGTRYHATPSGSNVVVRTRGARVMVSLQLAGGGVVELSFAAWGGSVAITPSALAYANLGGLCGFYDGLTGNDFRDAQNRTAATGQSSEALAGAFAESWRVRQDDTLFVAAPGAGLTGQRRVSDQAFPIHWAGDYAMPDSLPDACTAAGALPVSTAARYASAATFFSDACAYDAAMGGDARGAIHAFQATCHAYCMTGHMPHALVNASDCARVCVYDDPAFTPLDLHTRYGNDRLPTVQISGLDQPKIVFAPDQHFGGLFGLRLAVSDLCGTQHQNVSVNIVCVNPPTVSVAVGDGAADGTGAIHAGVLGWPDVFLVGAATSDLALAYSWRFVQTPRDQVTGQNVSAPVLLPNSRSPHVWFNPTYAGVWVAEFAVNDGCATVRTNLTVTVVCGSCPPAPVIAPLQPILWNGPGGAPNGQFGPALTNGQVPLVGHFSQDNDLGLAPQTAMPRYTWAFGAQPDTVQTTAAVAGTLYTTMARAPPVPYRDHTTALTDVTTAPGSVASGQTPLVVNPVEALYQATAVTTTTVQVRTLTNTTTSITPTPQVYCQFAIANYQSADASLQVLVPAGLPATSCVGSYNLTLTANDQCYTQTDAVPVVVACTKPVARIKCHTGFAVFNWQTMAFPALSFDGRDSYDASGDQSGRVYAPVDTFAWTAVGPQLCGDTNPTCSLGTAATVPSVTPVRGGTATVQLVTTNACGATSSTDTLTLALSCGGDVVARTPNYSFSYYPQIGLATKDGPVSGILSSLPSPGQWVGFAWQVVASGHPYPVDATFPTPVFTPASGAGLAAMNATFTNAYVHASQGPVNTYEAVLYADGGCARPSATFAIQVYCDTTFNIVMNGAGPGGVQYTVTWVQAANGGGAFGQATLNAAATTATSARWGATVPMVFHWQYNGGGPQPSVPLGSPNADITTFGPVTTPGVYPVQFVVHDPCSWEWTNAMVTAACLPSPTLTSSATVNPDNANPYNARVQLTSTIANGQYPDANMAWTWTRAYAPPGSAFLATANGNREWPYSPDRRGSYGAYVTATDGCFTVQALVTFEVTCIAFSVAVPATAQVVQWTDQQTTTLVADGSSWPSWLTAASFVYAWSIASAPNASVYAVWTRTATTQWQNVSTALPSVGPVNTTVVTTNTTVWNTTTTARTVTLTPLLTPGANPGHVWPACFRPDVGGDYDVAITVYPVGADDCPVVAHALVTNNCSLPPVAVLAPHSSNTTVAFSRTSATHLVLNASASYDPEGRPLQFWWSQISGPALVGDVLHNANTSTASFLASQSEQSYGFRLVVGDGCANTTVYTYLHAVCATPIAIANDSLYSWYDGEVPVPYMALGYDYSATVSPDMAAAHCQSYSWSLVAYSEQSEPYSPPSQPSTDITKTAGFIAGMTIACLVVAGGAGAYGYKRWKAGQNGGGASAASSGVDAGSAPYVDAGSYQPPQPTPAPAPQQPIGGESVALDPASAAAPPPGASEPGAVVPPADASQQV